MRPRFLAMFGCGSAHLRDAVARRVAAIFPKALDIGDISLFLEPGTAHVPLPQARGAIVGHVIDRTANARLCEMPLGRDLAVESTKGRHLIESCFGAYTALWALRGGGVSVLRDPSAGLPVYICRVPQATYVFSDIGIAASLGLFPLAVDWDMLAHGLSFEQLMTRATALSGVEEVLPGTRVDCGEAIAPELLWKPWTFARSSKVGTDPSEDAHMVEQAVDTAVCGWARTVGKVHLDLSGGLDSSILASALAATRAAWTCATVATSGDEADERHYAQSVAEHLGADLIKVDAIGLTLDPLAPLAHLTPKPRGMRVLAPLDRRFSDVADSVKADAIFNGMGGDNVFAYTRSTAPIIDAWRERGVSVALTIAHDVATLSRTPLSSVCAALARRLLVSPFARRWPSDTTFLACHALVRPQMHPWMRMPRRTAPGLRNQIGAIIRIHPFIDCLDRHSTRTMIFPLLSQPVMEACLAVPSWRWVEGGHNRALARHAFAGRLPEAVLLRRSKGGVDGMVVAAIEKRRPEIRSLLLEGHLAKSGLLDRQQLEIGLAAPFKERLSYHTRLIQLIDAELWVASVRSLAESIPLQT